MSDSFHHRETHAKLHFRYQLLNKGQGNHDIFFVLNFWKSRPACDFKMNIMQENERQRSHNFVNDFVFSVLKLFFFSEKRMNLIS